MVSKLKKIVAGIALVVGLSTIGFGVNYALDQKSIAKRAWYERIDEYTTEVDKDFLGGTASIKFRGDKVLFRDVYRVQGEYTAEKVILSVCSLDVQDFRNSSHIEYVDMGCDGKVDKAFGKKFGDAAWSDSVEFKDGRVPLDEAQAEYDAFRDKVNADELKL